jgi:hypothetical protein
MSIQVANRLEASRKELLDLGLRNPLINHRKRAKQIKVIDELSAEIFRLLVAEGKAMSFDALPEDTFKELDQSLVEVNQDTPGDGWEAMISQPEEDFTEGGLAARHVDTRLQTTFAADKLLTRLLSVHNDARTHIEEQGANILYLALGFLNWYETPTVKEPRRAPLLLIPVELSRTNAQERFRVAYTGEDIGDNLSLVEKMKTEFDLDLPKMGDFDELDVNAYFSSIQEAISEDERWSVQANEMTIGFFSFGKFLMYKDLNPDSWPEADKSDAFNF